ncbi:hypothetical protein [Herbiconiux flava]|uniref:Uncharacterized protein n=1 Tax=Herbiconiux flava TaxID=881268 RepID=A0A852SUH0_9MICO|nr:hypothetical protein [Herbiconiux flava]NYD72284.1 hypothetical protein [Herbiconiux flava]GLK17753.1 hypothetical protein GCM10017602_22350 [Herbiconiux flava]
MTRKFYVSFRESAVITEFVVAGTKREAIAKVRDGLGERIGFEIDETRNPTNFAAVEEAE